MTEAERARLALLVLVLGLAADLLELGEHRVDVEIVLGLGLRRSLDSASAAAVARW